MQFRYVHTTLHPIVNYYKTEDGNTITEEHIMLSDDLKHDKFAVRAFEKTTIDHLRSRGIVPTQIIQICNNCVGQYKSKGPFQFKSETKIPTVQMARDQHSSSNLKQRKNAFKPEGDQNFIQELFYITNLTDARR